MMYPYIGLPLTSSVPFLFYPQIRAYTVQVPLPGVPTYVVALIASTDKEKTDDILEQHQKMLALAQQSSLNVLSIGSDGAANEISAQGRLTQLASEFIRFNDDQSNVHIQIPLIGPKKQPLISVQDPKHARKTASNQLLSGARRLSFGRYYITISHLAILLQHQPSSLYQKDVFNSDKQDDGRAYRTFNDDTLAISLSNPECLGLSIYLFIMGELCDAWMNQSIDHTTRIKSAFRCYFFLRRWHAYLLERQLDSSGLMSTERNGISHQSHKIPLQLAESLLALIIAHRDYYPKFPFLPWKHGTEACEHIFGWMRALLANFPVLDAREMIPKIFLIVKNVISGKVKMPKSEHIHSGVPSLPSSDFSFRC